MKRTFNHFAVLSALPGTKAEIIRKAKLNSHQVRNALRTLRKTHQAYISGVTAAMRGGPQVPVYSAGHCDDAITARPIPAARSDEQWNAAALRKIDLHIAQLVGQRATWCSALLSA